MAKPNMNLTGIPLTADQYLHGSKMQNLEYSFIGDCFLYRPGHLPMSMYTNNMQNGIGRDCWIRNQKPIAILPHFTTKLTEGILNIRISSKILHASYLNPTIGLVCLNRRAQNMSF